MKEFEFKIIKKLEKKKLKGLYSKKFLGRVGIFKTPHGNIKTPSFAAVGTKANIKGLTIKQLEKISPEIFLANTYHLYFSPNSEVVKKAGGLHKFSGWSGPLMTDSGGFQAFSLGAAFGENISKIAKDNSNFSQVAKNKTRGGDASSSEIPITKKMAKITEDGVEFRSYKDGSKHFFSPEKSIQIQHDLGADIIFAFDECTSPQATYEYQEEAMNRTHRWAVRSLLEHQKLATEKIAKKTKNNNENEIALFGIVQGGRFKDLREESAKFIGKMNFEGFGIGGSFDKDDMDKAVRVVNELLPENKPRHLLGIGEPLDLFMGIENGIDFFDCVIPTRLARHGTLFTENGKINIKNAKYKNEYNPIQKNCSCYTCQNHTKAYLHHLIKEKEILGMTLSSIHNLYFIVNLVKKIRQSILDENFFEFKKDFLKKYFRK